jgi:hypothetical protein
MRPTVLALGAAYGAIGLTAALFLISGRIISMIIAANGLLYGFMAIQKLGDAFPVLLPVQPPSPVGFHVKILYIFLGYYLSVSLPRILASGSYTREKYEALCSGLFGIYAGWILTLGFGSASAIFAGVSFLIATFVCTAAVEVVATPVIYALKVNLSDNVWKALDSERRYSWAAVRSVFSLKIFRSGEAWIVFGFSALWPALITLIMYLREIVVGA